MFSIQKLRSLDNCHIQSVRPEDVFLGHRKGVQDRDMCTEHPLTSINKKVGLLDDCHFHDGHFEDGHIRTSKTTFHNFFQCARRPVTV